MVSCPRRALVGVGGVRVADEHRRSRTTGSVWGAMLVAMAAMFVAALAVPDGFGRHGVVFGVAFLIVNVMQLALYALAARGDRDLLAAILRIAPVGARRRGSDPRRGIRPRRGSGRSSGWPRSSSACSGRCSRGVDGWRVHPAHFVERHGLIVIIAIGESLVAIGLGAREHRARRRRDRRGRARLRRRDVVLARVLRLLPDPRRSRCSPTEAATQRTALARDVYTYLHLPMVAGIVLFAFAMKTTLAHVGDELDTIPALALCGGPALYLLAYVGVRVRVVAHARPRPPARRGRLRAAVPGRARRAGARRAHARRRRLGRAPRLRAHLVARSPRRDRARRPPVVRVNAMEPVRARELREQ